jgi:hypothetical protein
MSNLADFCDWCSLPASARCARCRAVAFCGTACQKQAWPHHKGFCLKPLPATAAQAIDVSSAQIQPIPRSISTRSSSVALLRQNSGDRSRLEIRPWQTGHTSPGCLGVFANRPFEPGDCVVSELMVVEGSVDATAFVSESELDAACAHLKHQLQTLHLSAREAVEALYNAKSAIFSGPYELLGKFFSNCLPTSSGRAGLFPFVSRFNHSCLPNAQHGYCEATREQRLYALRHIAADEQIFIDYVDSCFKPGPQRRAELRSGRRLLIIVM